MIAAQVTAGSTAPPDQVSWKQEEELLSRLKETKPRTRRASFRWPPENRGWAFFQLADLGTARRSRSSIGTSIRSPTADVAQRRGEQGTLAAGPLLLRAVRTWGRTPAIPSSAHLPGLARRSSRICAVLAGTTSDGVRRAIRAELIRLQDRPAIEELRRASRARRSKPEDAQRAIDLLSSASECVAVVAEVGLLFRRVDPGLSATHRQLKQYAAGVALWLGDRDSAGQVIDLLTSPGSAYFDYPGLLSLDDVLKRQTHQAFRSPQEWKAWWVSGGSRTPLFTIHVPPADEAGIINGALAGGTGPGPLIENRLPETIRNTGTASSPGAG
jgi:hypothetical protein